MNKHLQYFCTIIIKGNYALLFICLNLEMKAKCQMETDTQLNLNISRVKKNKQILQIKHQNNGCLLFIVMYCVYNKLLRKNWNLPLNFRYFHFSTRSSTFLTACWLAIFFSIKPRQTVLQINRSGMQFQSYAGDLKRKLTKTM